MNITDINLIDSLLNTSDESQDDNDVGLEIINSIYDTLNINEICKYHDINSYTSAIPVNFLDYLNILQVNTRSLNKNYDNLISLLKSLPKFPDILCISETWLKPNTAPLNEIEGYKSYHTLRPDGYGGVAIYVKQDITSIPLSDYCLSNDIAELCTIKITIDNSNYVISSLYRPHDKHDKVNEFNLFMDNFLSQNIFIDNQTIVTGDFNINLLEHDTHLPTNHFLTIMQSYNYYPHISRPTRFPDVNTTASPSLLDHIWTNFTAPSSPGILLFPLSDHLPVFLNLPILHKHNMKHKLTYRPRNAHKCTEFKAKLSAIDWNMLLSYEDTNINCNLFLDTVYSIYYSCFPKLSKYISTKRLEKPWITQGIIKSIKHKFSLYKAFQLGIVDHDLYKNYRNYLNNLIKSTKKHYYLQKFSDFRLNTKKIWKTINELTNAKTKTNTTTESINYNNQIKNTPQEISEAFNDYFSMIAPELASKLPPTAITHISYLRGNYPHSMVMPIITELDIEKVITSLKNKKGHIDEIPVNLIKENKEVFAKPLTILFNQSVSTGLFPDRLKVGKIVPIHKTGSKTDISNYRPISILPIFSKIFEATMKKHLMLYLTKKKILNDCQFGFRPGLSTFDAINTFTSDLYMALNKSKSILSIFIDFRKAFDTVQPNILLDKMHYYGIRGCIYNWFSSYLSNRIHYTVFNNTPSQTKPVHLGVPQGSILGPLLFLLYINDISNISVSLNSILFADDSTFYMTGDTPTETINKANLELQKFSDWCLANRITVNTSKTYYMLFTNSITCYQPLPNLTILNDDITQVDKIKFLGIILDKNLNFKQHLSNLCLKLSRVIPLLLKVKHFAPVEILRNLYYAHIYPHLSYCNPIWSTTYPCHLYNLNVLHKKTVRIMSSSEYLAHTPPLFKSLNIMNLADISRFNIALYMFKQIKYNHYNTQPLHNYQTRNQHTLRTPSHKLTLFTHSLMYLGPKTWNDVPLHIKHSTSISSFKNKFKKHLLSFY